MKKLMLIAALCILATGCNEPRAKVIPKSDSGVSKVSVKVVVGADGKTVEQRNVAERVKRDNSIGSYKHLYVISAYSGDVIIYSTVKGKVTSSGKRLTPTSVAATNGQYVGKEHYGMLTSIGGKRKYTPEVLQDDGTYGNSIPYIFWFDSKGVYHQHYVTGGQILHVTDAPMVVGKIIINMEITE